MDLIKILLISLSPYANDSIPPNYVPILQPIASSEFKYVSSAYGWRKHPKTKQLKFHEGIDIVTYTDKAKIFSTAEGMVVEVSSSPKLGQSIRIQHANATYTKYGHLSQILVKKGDKVKAGELIGIIGETGEVTGVHLHYEIIYKGKPIDPIKFQENFKKTNINP